MPEHVAGADLAGLRFDQALARAAGITRSAARRLIDDGAATLDGVVAVARTKVKEGAVLILPVVEEVIHLPDPTVEFGVLYEDDDLVVVDKPAGLVVHAGPGSRVQTLASGAAARWPEMTAFGEPGRWGLVHRLDRGTSGALLIAKQERSLVALQDALRRREIHRRYLALAEGSFSAPTGTIDAPIDRDPRVPVRMRVSSMGRAARTHYRVSEEFGQPELTLLEVRLETGRTHQIRVHMTSIGHPLVGDTLYRSTTTPTLGLNRNWLHAASLGFVHPTSGDPIEVQSSLPEELAASLELLRQAAGT